MDSLSEHLTSYKIRYVVVKHDNDYLSSFDQFWIQIISRNWGGGLNWPYFFRISGSKEVKY